MKYKPFKLTKPNRLRGIGGNFIIIEEAAYVKPDIYREIILPIIAVRGTAFLALSTLSGKTNNFFSKLIKSKVIKHIQIDFICKKCIPLELKEACIHNRGYFPKHIDETAVDFIQSFYGEEGEDAYLREMLGVVGKEDTPECFDVSLVEDFFHKPRMALQEQVDYVFIVIDPCAGSIITDPDKRPSDFAVISVGMPGYYLLGVEAWNVNHDYQYKDNLVKHAARIMEHPLCRDATIVLDVESGTGLTVSEVYTLFNANFRKIVTMDDSLQKPGRQMLPTTKFDLVKLTQIALARKEYKIWDHFVTSAKDERKLMTTFMQQMLDYAREETVLPSGAISVRYTGKTGGRKDDIGLTFQRAIRSVHDFHNPVGKYTKHWTAYTRHKQTARLAQHYDEIIQKGNEAKLEAKKRYTKQS